MNSSWYPRSSTLPLSAWISWAATVSGSSECASWGDMRSQPNANIVAATIRISLLIYLPPRTDNVC